MYIEGPHPLYITYIWGSASKNDPYSIFYYSEKITFEVYLYLI